MCQRLFTILHTKLGWPALIAAKLALVLVVLVLFGTAEAFFSMGVPMALVHLGALAAIVGLLIWQGAHRSMTAETEESTSDLPKTPHIGILLHSAAMYDTLAWILTYGRERAFREKMLRFAELQSGEAVLDVGCGTGTVALLAKKQVGPKGRVDGVDASPDMVARATAKARGKGIDVRFSNAIAQNLPYKSGEFDIVLSTLMFHHLPKAGRAAFSREVFRVLKPGGRWLIVDFPKPLRQSRFFQLHRHGHVDLDKIAVDLGGGGFSVAEQGDVGTRGLRYLIARRCPGVTLEPR
ncbi:class I SAM-dependent methyltransferase [Sphingosinicella sp. LHD-64]|uniref:class I SAM-dependent methyltransferase n=1 Tax=Sphingosinicella sp. LHD-64 TaxID=3072139 RepID=UPI00280D023D|nr:class I SAM-dependent methyltransferase [Sphingosinicella sp. LHD-64]MDQ8757415.1 class I SAM-dependent methyltransferase [Sphingosinicella sp. LHD-64]